jgi:adenylosuccinate lyase
MSVRSVSPLDGRYAGQIQALADYFSEWALIKYRIHVEVEWLIMMAGRPEISHVRPFTDEEADMLRSWVTEFGDAQAERVKAIEQTTRHDVKAVEYYLKERLRDTPLDPMREAVHFCCTSEDINNLAYALMLRDGIQQEWLPRAQELVDRVAALARAAAKTPMLTRTHGQPATPSTLGKELAVFAARWRRQLRQIEQAEYLGKFNGAVGNYNAHVIAYPDAPWEDIARAFVERLGLTFNPLTTQIEPHDYMAELFHTLMRFNTVTLDFVRDMWIYISLGYFRQEVVKSEVGSSIMPHKVNPIDFENAEANLGVSNALLDHLAGKLQVSRLQRDLSDSSALRNVGAAIGYSVLAVQSAIRGMRRVAVDETALQRDLDQAWEVLAEAVQTVMRKAGHQDPYEQMKALTRGEEITRETMQAFIRNLDLSEEDRTRLLALSPAAYTGLAEKLLDHIDASAEGGQEGC